MQVRKEGTFAKNLEKDLDKVLKAFKKLQSKNVFCEKGGLEAVREFMAPRNFSGSQNRELRAFGVYGKQEKGGVSY